MTTIAYRDGVLAGDSCFSIDTYIIELRSKLHRLNDGSIVGYCGSPDDFVAIHKWLNGKDVEPDFSSTTVLRLTKSSLLKYDAQIPLKLNKKKYIAIGTGMPIALGALYAGATAIEAVKAAIAHDSKSRGPVTWMTLIVP